MEKFNDTLCLITGASSGIGKYLATEFVKRPQLTVIGLSRRKVDDIKSENFQSLQCDVSKPNEIKATFEHIKTAFPNKRISILVNNAGLAKPYPLIDHEKLSEDAGVPHDFANFDAAADAFATMLNVNVLGLSLVTYAAVALMDHNACGNIVNINSMSGHRMTKSPTVHFYAATKHAVTALTEGLRMEFRAIGSKIRVGAVSPGFVATEFFQGYCGSDAAFLKQMEELCERMPALQSEDIWNAVKVMVEADERCQIGDMLLRPTNQES